MQSLHPEPGARYRNVMDALRQIVRTEGVWRPIRGVNVLAVGAGPAHALYFACYEKIKFSLSSAIHPGANSHFANGEIPSQTNRLARVKSLTNSQQVVFNACATNIDVRVLYWRCRQELLSRLYSVPKEWLAAWQQCCTTP